MPGSLHVAAVLVALAPACAVGTRIDVDLPELPAKVAATTTTTAPDSSGVALERVPGSTTLPPLTTVPGPSSLSGVVRGPDGPVVGATVRVERLVDTRAVVTDVVSAPDGTWRLDGIPGGRYRLRAWRAPDLAGRPVVLFLQPAKPQRLDLTVARRDGLAVSASIAPSPPVTGEPANLAVRVYVERVDDQGIVRADPQAGLVVDLVVAGDWSLLSPASAVTDAAGQAGWRLVCGSPGSQRLAVAVGPVTFALPLPSCVEPPPPTTTTTTSSTTTTTTIRPRGRPGPPTTAGA